MLLRDIACSKYQITCSYTVPDMTLCAYTAHKTLVLILIDFSLAVKAATLKFIYGRG